MNQLDLVLCDRPDLSEDLLLNKDVLVLLQLSFRNPLLQELLILSGTHYQTPSPRWLRYHPSETICLLHHARRRAHSIAEICVRSLAIIIQIQTQIQRRSRQPLPHASHTPLNILETVGSEDHQ